MTEETNSPEIPDSCPKPLTSEELETLKDTLNGSVLSCEWDALVPVFAMARRSLELEKEISRLRRYIVAHYQHESGVRCAVCRDL